MKFFLSCILLVPVILNGQIRTHRPDGVYTGISQGYSGAISVQVTVKSGQVAGIMITEYPEYELPDAFMEIPGRILGASSLDAVDTVTGATISSAAIVEAVRKALGTSPESKDSPGLERKISLGARTVLPAPVWVIGSFDSTGNPNAMTAAWVGICCSRPPALMIALRKATYTYGNIMQTKAFTVNIPSEKLAPAAAYFGRVSGRDVDKFAESGLTPVLSDSVNAPFIKEFPLIVECRVIHELEIGLHTMFIGRIMDVKADPSILSENGGILVDRLKPLIFSPGMGGFYGVSDFLGTIAEFIEKN
ncbi:MAG TPA: FMN-binding protein [bacterium]|nr:FMN-binding protein [bacterium]